MQVSARTKRPAAARRITDSQRRKFGEQGYLMVPGALRPGLLERLQAATDRVYAEEALADRLRPDHSLHLLGFVTRDGAFCELLDLETTFPLVWGLLGWNIHCYHSHLDVNPPVVDPGPPFWGWHQDGGRQNLETETDPRPLLSVKVAYVLSDLSLPGRGNTRIIPGSQRRNSLPRPARPELGFEEPKGATEVLANAGDAFVFDRRLWHSRSVNTSEITRKMLFVAYTYRWIRARDDLRIKPDSPWWRSLSPVRRQLLGEGSDAMSYWGLGRDSWPLREQLHAQKLLDPEVPPQR